MIRLAFDTATDRLTVALGDDGELLGAAHLDGARRHAGALLGLVDRVLGEAGVPLPRVGGLVIADGPGSFTGLRVGAAVAKALVRARAVELRAAPSLMVRARAVGGTAPVAVTANALRGDLYAAVYRFSDRVTAIRPPEVVASAALEGWIPPGTVRAPEAPPDARHLLALARLPGGAQRIDAVEEWEPEYGRPAEAQVQWERRHGRPLPGSPGVAG